MSLDIRINAVRAAVGYRDERLRAIQKSTAELEAEYAALERDLADNQEAERLAEACMRSEAGMRAYLEQLATIMLQGKFGPTYEFRFDEVLRPKSDVLAGLRPTIYKDGVPRREGGGATALCDFALNLGALLALRKLAPVLMLDEPFSELSKPTMSVLASEIAAIHKLMPWFQLIVVSHEPDFTLPTMFELSAVNPGTKAAKARVSKIDTRV